MKLVCAELSLRNCRDRLLDIFLRKRADLEMVFLKLEWALVSTAYTLKSLHRMVGQSEKQAVRDVTRYNRPILTR